MKIANMATFPARLQKIDQTLRSIRGQFDRVNLVLNEYEEVPRELAKHDWIDFVLPTEDLKDVGKFHPFDRQPDDWVFLLDDDIVYPADYAERLIDYYETIPLQRKVIGVHGIVYSDFFDGRPQSRLVHSFTKRLEKFVLVNQLGTGTVLCKGEDMPTFEFMQGSQRYVDVRFACWQKSRGVDLVCVPRSSDWMRQREVDDSIFEGFTQTWPAHVTREALGIAGFSKLDAKHWKQLAEWNESLVRSLEPA